MANAILGSCLLVKNNISIKGQAFERLFHHRAHIAELYIPAIQERGIVIKTEADEEHILQWVKSKVNSKLCISAPN